MMFIKEIQKDIEWRLGELGTLKSLTKRYKMLKAHQEMIIRYSIPAIYAIWEGFVKVAFSLYSDHLNKKGMKMSTVHVNLITYAIEVNDKLRLNDGRTNIQTQREFVQAYNDFYESPFFLVDKVMTNDNVDFKVINSLLSSYNIEQLSNVYEKKLNRLLFLRNEVAHGETKVPIEMTDVEQYSELVEILMNEIVQRIENGYVHQTYLKDTCRTVFPTT